MAASMCRSLIKAKNLRNLYVFNNRVLYSTSPDQGDGEIMFGSGADMVKDVKQGQPTRFASMFRHSLFAQLGELKDKKVIGTIDYVRGDDLYIDFGGKFHCVCQRPARNSEKYKKGVQVKLLLHDLEMASSFLGSDKHISLLEADCTLLGLVSVRVKQIQPGASFQESEIEYDEHDFEVTSEAKGFVDKEAIDMVAESPVSQTESVKDTGKISVSKLLEIARENKKK